MQNCYSFWSLRTASESLSQILWNKCPKSVFIERKVLELGVSSAVVGFNEGARGLCKVLENLGIKEGKCTKTSYEADRKQKREADFKKMENGKKMRKSLRPKKKGL